MGGTLYSLFKHALWCIGLLWVLASPAKAELTVLTSIDAPSSYLEAGKVMGTAADIAREILRRIGSDAKIQIQPWARVYESALHKSNIMALTVGKTPEREALGFHFVGPIMTRHHAIYTIKGKHSDIQSLEALAQRYLPVGGLRKDWRSLYLKEHNIRLDLSNDLSRTVKKLQSGRYDLIVGSDVETQAQLYDNNLPKDYVEVLLPLAEASSYIIFSKETDPELLKRVRKAFKEIQQSDFGHITAAKYSKRFNYDLTFSPEKGIFCPPVPTQ